MGLNLNVEEEKVFKENDKLIHFTINKYFPTWRTIHFVEYDDLYQIGAIGLIKAIKRFDPEKFDTKLSTYAVPMIFGEIRRYFRDDNYYLKIPRKIKEAYRKLIRTYIDFNELDYKMLMEEYDLNEDFAKLLIEYLDVSYVSKDEKNKVFNGKNKITFEDMLSDENKTINNLIDKMELEKRLSILTERERGIVKLSLKGLTQNNIASIYNVSQVQISRIIKKSIEKINEEFDAVVV